MASSTGEWATAALVPSTGRQRRPGPRRGSHPGDRRRPDHRRPARHCRRLHHLDQPRPRHPTPALNLTRPDHRRPRRRARTRRGRTRPGAASTGVTWSGTTSAWTGAWCTGATRSSLRPGSSTCSGWPATSSSAPGTASPPARPCRQGMARGPGSPRPPRYRRSRARLRPCRQTRAAACARQPLRRACLNRPASAEQWPWAGCASQPPAATGRGWRKP